MTDSMTPVAIIMGSQSDWATMSHAAETLKALGLGHKSLIVSAHRTPDRLYHFAKSARDEGYKVIIAGAGGAAHLPGMLAAKTSVPVLGVPVPSKHLQGVDSLHSIVQMPPGVPVATVAINGARNAGLLALEILATSSDVLTERIIAYKKQMQNSVEEKAQQLEQLGFEKYLRG